MGTKKGQVRKTARRAYKKKRVYRSYKSSTIKGWSDSKFWKMFRKAEGEKAFTDKTWNKMWTEWERRKK
tara:strand:- start:344 stop:550 length:207 start_codon:yes stop_codon:yes gene_type:complete